MRYWTAVALLASAPLLAQTGGALDFRVITTGDAPVAAATVTLEGPNGRTYSGATARDGHFRLTNLAPGVYRFTAFDAPGYIRAPKNFLADVSIHEGQTRQFQFELLPAPRLQGTLFDEEGRPVPDATVVARGPGMTGSAKTNAEGFYSMALTSPLDTFLTSYGFLLPELRVSPITLIGVPTELSVPRPTASTAPITVEFQTPMLQLNTTGTLNLYLRMETASIR